MSRALGLLLELGGWTPTLWCGPLSWGAGLPRFTVSPRVGVMVFKPLKPRDQLQRDIYTACARNSSCGAKPKSTDTKSQLIYKRVLCNYL